jgi:hypothetical protein
MQLTKPKGGAPPFGIPIRSHPTTMPVISTVAKRSGETPVFALGFALAF